jgi:hypothetical protein
MLIPSMLVGAGGLFLAVSNSACEKEIPSCEQAVATVFRVCLGFPYGNPPYGPGGLHDDQEGALRYCDQTLAAAQDQGCAADHERFRRCMGSTRQCDDGWARDLCDREEAALHACLAGQSDFELDCADGGDGDGDGAPDCWDADCVDAGACACSHCLSIPQSAARALDLLLVIDNSGSMADPQALLRSQFDALVALLQSMRGGPPDLHLGVTSTDLGAGDYGLPYCEEPEGDRGDLLTGACTNPVGSPWIVDAAPRGCTVSRDGQGGCTEHDCDQTHCAHEPSTTLEVDAPTGCPRCRNYAGEALEYVLDCLGDLGTQGCGFEQPLEAMVRALGDNPRNAGFLHEDAMLGVMFLTDEDDCSASDPSLFDPSATAMDSPLGPLSSFRCFEFGVTCDTDSRTAQGERYGCAPREDPDALLHPVSRYVSFLESLQDPQLLAVTALAGPVDVNHSVTIGRDPLDQPMVENACTGSHGGAKPGIRLQAVIESFNDLQLDPGAYASICYSSYHSALEELGRRVQDTLEEPCLPAPPEGCPDIGAAHGAPNDECADNDVCRPRCLVNDVYARGTPDEQRRWVPPCLAVCADGPCPGNTDAAQAYAGGHPPARDPDLPVEACWYIGYQPACASSNFAQVRVSRRADPPPRSFSLVHCLPIPQQESLCNDGVDNDEDCLVDAADPDCST